MSRRSPASPRLTSCASRSGRSEGRPTVATDVQEDVAREVSADVITAEVPDAELTIRNDSRRELDARLVPWDTVVETPIGLEAFRRGSFAKVDPKKVVLLLGHDG